MSLIKQSSFLKRFFTFQLSLTYLVEYKDVAFEMVIFRGNTTRSVKLRDGIIITPTWMYISKSIRRLFHTDVDLDNWLKDLSNPWFQKKSQFKNPYSLDEIEMTLAIMDWEFEGKHTSYMDRLPVEEETYFLVLNKNTERRSRFYPRKSEMQVYMKLLDKYEFLHFPNGTMTKSTMSDMLTTTSEVYMEVCNFYEKMYMSTRMREELEDIMTMEDTRTYFDTEMKFNLNRKSVSTWLHTRHNMFGMAVLIEMGMDIPMKFDVNLVDDIKYDGLYSHKTPDYIYERDEKIVVVDFAVTVGNMINIVDNKRTSYESLVEDMSKHLEKEVVLEVIVWQISDGNSFYLPPHFEKVRKKLEENKMLKDIKGMHEKLKTNSTYQMLAFNLDLSLEDVDISIEEKRSLYINLMSKMIDMYKIDNKVAYDVTDSRKDKIKKEMKPLLEMEIMEDLIATSKTDHKEYLKKVEDDLKAMINQNMMPNHLAPVFERDDAKIRSKLNNSLKEQERIRKSIQTKDFTMPKVFKFPMLTNKDGKSQATPLFFMFENILDDGTVYLRDSRFPVEDRRGEFLEFGLGLDIKEDTTLMDTMYDNMIQKHNSKDRNLLGFFEDMMDMPFLKDLMESKLWEMVTFVSTLMENISYMEGRRHLYDNKRGHTVAKAFGNYILMVNKGSKLTAEKQIRYKIFCKREFLEYEDSLLFHTWKEFDSDYMMTKWLTVSVTDIQHFLKVREVTVGMASDYYDKRLEMHKSKTMVPSIMDRSFVFSVLIMMEHRRGTSTSLQLNRYLLHSSCSYLTNREKLVDDIHSDPSRSRLEAYVKFSQTKWFLHMLGKQNELNYNRIKKMMSTDTDYDRVYFPSFFDLKLNMEFGMMMNEMYLCNLFNKEAGFTDHRVKQIVSKMTAAEIHFQKVKHTEWSKGNIKDLKEFWMSNDEMHIFDKRFVVSATKLFFSEPKNQVLMLDAMVTACTEVIDSAMMMTSSLTGGKYKSEALDFKDRVTKTKSFLSLFDLLKDMPTHLLIGMVSEDEVIDAIFAVFPKSQIGGPREILIQAVKLRIMVKFLETISFQMCERHSKEMITKDAKKAEIQSQTMSSFREEMMTRVKRGASSIMASFNADASKWSPGFVMENFMHFCFNFETDRRMRDFMCTVVSSFSNKVMLTPDRLREKWRNKPSDQDEYDENIQVYRRMDDETEGCPVIESGMGQGMFHKLSSFYHVVIDDAIDHVLGKIMLAEHTTALKTVTLVSSDDKTKMLLFQFPNMSESDKAMKTYLLSLDCLYRLANIHTNWKKSGLQFIITEFNSLFSIGKRMNWASIKDIYTANDIPDLTAPEEAVKFMISNIRRCFEHGVYLDTIKILLKMARNQLKRYYRYDHILEEELCKLLDTEKEELPVQLGFVPTTKVIETMLVGPDLHMFKTGMSSSLKSFYKGLYTAGPEFSTSRSRHYIPFEETGSGKFWLELPTRIDKKLLELKNEFYKERLGMTQEDIIKQMNTESINVNLAVQDILNHTRFKNSYFVGMNRKFEFQETMVVHSLVRALQLAKGKGHIFPKPKEQVEIDDILMSSASSKEEKAKALMDTSTFSVDVKQFVRFCISRKDKRSSKNMMGDMYKICRMSDEIEMDLRTMVKSQRMNHPMMRTLQFNMEEYKSTFQKNDLINYIFDKKSDFKNSSLKAFEKMVHIFGFESLKVWDNPFKFMRDMMSDKDYCYKAFSEFVNFLSKTSGNIRMRMLSDFPDSGNFKINLINLYRSKTSPLYILEHSNTKELSKEDIDFVSKMAFSSDTSDLTKSRVTISMEDRRVTQARKLMTFGTDKMVSMGRVQSARLYYKTFNSRNRDSKMFVWTDFSFVAWAEEFKEKGVRKVRVDIKGKDRNAIEDNKNFISVRRFLKDHSDVDIIYTQKSVVSEDGMVIYSCDPTSMNFKMSVSHMMMKYEVNLEIHTNRVFKGMAAEAKIHLFRDSYSFDSNIITDIYLKDSSGSQYTLRDCLETPPPIETLDDILLTNNWIKKDLLIKSDDLTEEDIRNADITMINQQFAAEGVTSMFSNFLDFEAEEEIRPTTPEDPQSLIGMLSSLNTITKALHDMDRSDKEEWEIERFKVEDTASIIAVVEKIVKEACSSYLRCNISKIREIYKMSKENLQLFHNLMIWALKDSFPDLSDSMILMMYNTKLKEISMSLFISRASELELITPSLNTRESIRKMKLFTKVTEEDRLNMLSMLEEFRP